MKKNNVMRIASALLVAVLLTTCAISGTFAKYTTTASGSSTARVAKWGFGTGDFTFDLFDGTYENVATDAESAVIAPGTSDSTTIVFDASGNAATTEVAYTFTAYLEITGNAALIDQMQWSLDGTTYKSAEEIEQDFAALFNEETVHQPGTEPVEGDITIYWKWPFSNGAEEDTQDTQIGANGAEVTVTIGYTATQVGVTETTAELE